MSTSFDVVEFRQFWLAFAKVDSLVLNASFVRTQIDQKSTKREKKLIWISTNVC